MKVVVMELGDAMSVFKNTAILLVMLLFAGITLSSRGDLSIQPKLSPLVGTYVFSGELTPVMKIQVEKVQAISDIGRQRLLDLQQQDYGCHHVQRGTWRCARQSPLVYIEDWVPARIEKMMISTAYQFEASVGGVEPLIDANGFKSWRIHQTVVSDVATFDSYEWTWTPSITKIILRDKSSAALPKVSLNLDESLQISQQYSMTHTLDRNRFEIHLVQAHFEMVSSP